MGRSLLLGCMALAFLPVFPAAAETIEDVARQFGARQSVLDADLSPSGKRLAYIAPGNGSSELVFIVELDGDMVPKQVLAHGEPDSEITDCAWATDEQLVCEAYYILNNTGLLLGATRRFAIGADGTNLVRLTARDRSDALGFQQHGGSILALDVPGKPGRILMTREWVKEFSTGTRLANTDEGLGVEEVDVSTGRRSRIESPDFTHAGFIADDRGRVRMKMEQSFDSNGYLVPERRYYYRDEDARSWKLLTTVDTTEPEEGFRPIAVDAGRNVAFGRVRRAGYDAIATMALDGSARTEVILARDDVDVDGLIRIGRQRRVVGVTYATERREIAYFDSELERLAAQLGKALPGQPLIEIVGASADEGRLLVIASSDTDPGMLYLYDKAARRLEELVPLRQELAGRSMGTMTAVSFPVANGTSIPGYLTLPPGSDGKGLPAIVLPHGGPSSRDEWGFDWLVQFFAARGYAVLQPNFRGSSGYGSAWFGRNGFQAWRTAIGDVNEAGRWLVKQGIADPERLSIVGWSYGGYAALQSHVLDGGLYRAVIAIAPVTDLERLREESRPYTNFRLVERFVGQGPHIDEGSPARHADAFSVPVLLFHGTLDQNVSVSQSRLMRDRLEQAGKPVKYIEYAERDHFIADASARSNMLYEIDRFLETSRAP